MDSGRIVAYAEAIRVDALAPHRTAASHRERRLIVQMLRNLSQREMGPAKRSASFYRTYIMAVKLAAAPHLRTMAAPGTRYRVGCCLRVWRLSACRGQSHVASAASRGTRTVSKTRDLQTANVSPICLSGEMIC